MQMLDIILSHIEYIDLKAFLNSTPNTSINNPGNITMFIHYIHMVCKTCHNLFFSFFFASEFNDYCSSIAYQSESTSRTTLL